MNPYRINAKISTEKTEKKCSQCVYNGEYRCEVSDYYPLCNGPWASRKYWSWRWDVVQPKEKL